MDLFIFILLMIIGIPMIIIQIIESTKNYRYNKQMYKKWLDQKYDINNMKCECCGFPIPPAGRVILCGIPSLILKKYRIEKIRCHKCKWNREIIIKYNGICG